MGEDIYKEAAGQPAATEDDSSAEATSAVAVDQLKLPEAIKKDLGEVVEALPADQKVEVIRLFKSVSKMHSGPLPDPETLAAYGQLIPDAPSRLMAIVENREKHRQEIERLVAMAQVSSLQVQGKAHLRGQLIGLFLAVLFAAIGTAFAFNGMPELAGVVFATTLVSLVAVFVIGKKHAADEEDNSKSDAEK